MLKNTTESMGLKENTINFLLFSGTTKSLRNHQKIKEPENNSFVRPIDFSRIFRTLKLMYYFFIYKKIM